MQGSLSCFLISATWRARVGGFPNLPAMPCESWYRPAVRRRAARAGDCGAAPSAIMVSSAGGEPAKKLRHFLLGFGPEAAAYSRPACSTRTRRRRTAAARERRVLSLAWPRGCGSGIASVGEACGAGPGGGECAAPAAVASRSRLQRRSSGKVPACLPALRTAEGRKGARIRNCVTGARTSSLCCGPRRSRWNEGMYRLQAPPALRQAAAAGWARRWWVCCLSRCTGRTTSGGCAQAC